MSKVSESILKGAKEALAYAQGHKTEVKVHKVKIPAKINVLDIRKKLHMSRLEFAHSFGFSIRTLEKWEQGVRQPEGAARAYLLVIKRKPKMVEAALRS